MLVSCCVHHNTLRQSAHPSSTLPFLSSQLRHQTLSILSTMGQQQQNQHLVMALNDTMWTACYEGHVETILSLLDAGKNVNCVSRAGQTPIMFALWHEHLHVAIMLAGRGADLSRVDNPGSNILHYAAIGGDCECIEWVIANTTIGVNSIENNGTTLIYWALRNPHFDAGKLLVENGANLFKKDNDGESVMNSALAPQALQHAKDLIWESVKPLLLLSSACSTSTTSSSLIKVFSISGLVRDYILRTF
jgi:hypothetical protein